VVLGSGALVSDLRPLWRGYASGFVGIAVLVVTVDVSVVLRGLFDLSRSPVGHGTYSGEVIAGPGFGNLAIGAEHDAQRWVPR
jgi:hypothetical protein